MDEIAPITTTLRKDEIAELADLITELKGRYLSQAVRVCVRFALEHREELIRWFDETQGTPIENKE